jgi:tellurite resistance protein TerC
MASRSNDVVPTALRPIRRAAIFLLGMSVLIVGVAMIVLPGPAFLVIPAGLGILSLEFVWAKRLLTRAREMIAKKLYQRQTSSRQDG